MRKHRFIISFLLGAWLATGLSACNNAETESTAKLLKEKNALEIKELIATGRRVENVSNDSLLLVANRLLVLQKLTGDKPAIAYAELFVSNYHWQAAHHKLAMQLALKCMADAERYNVRPVMIEIQGTIANLHKETTNYPMAFKSVDNGLNLAVADKDTAHMIAFLGLKAMFTRGLNLSHHKPQADNSIDLNLAALKIAESSPKYERMRTRFYDNIAQYYKDQHDYNNALYYGNKGVESATKFNQQRSLTYAYSWLGQATYFAGQREKGTEYLNKALQIALTLKEPYRAMEIHEHMYDCFMSGNDMKNALKHNGLMRNIRDSLKVLDNAKQISDLQLKYETAKKDKEITLLHDKEQLQILQRNGIIVIFILLVAIAVLIYIKERKGKDLLMSEKLLLNEGLKNAELELLYFTDNLKQKNEIIEEFKVEIEHLHSQHLAAADTENLENLVKAHIMTDESWDGFKKLFAKVHISFFNTLKQNHPYLTQTDTRMLSLIKLQLSNYEMSNMLGITIEGIKKSKQRLRKKMELDQDDSLESVVIAM
jgi:DNA-binding CsgD family transcriptional regulator